MEQKSVVNNVVNKMKPKRIFYFDILRVIACLSVVMIHSSSYVETIEIGSLNYWIAIILNSISRIGVPLFVMISGALLLDENYDFSIKKLINHIVKIIIFFLFWSVAYSILQNLIPKIIHHEKIDVLSLAKSIIIGNYHLWFCYMIIGLYLLVPLLRLWIKKENKEYIKYFIILSLIFTYLLPQIINIGSMYSSVFYTMKTLIDRVDLSYVGGYVPFFILGWYLHNFQTDKIISYKVLGIIGFVLTAVFTYILSYSKGEFVSIMIENLTVNVLFQAVSVFILIKSKYTSTDYDQKKIIHKVIDIISKCSLGVYAMHAAVILICMIFVDRCGFDLSIATAPCVFIISFLISLIVSYIFKKIPILRALV